MPTACLMLCLIVLAPSLGLAQTPTEPAPAPEAPLSPPPLIPAPEPSTPEGESIPYNYRPAEEQRDTTRRLVLEGLAGGTGIVAGIAGLLSGVLLVGRDCQDAACAIPVLSSMSLGIILGTPLGVYGVGRAMGGHGTFLGALGGTLLGSVVGLGLAVLSSSAGSPGLGLVGIIAGPVAGALVGYELSAPGTEPPPTTLTGPGSSASGFRCIPVFSVTPAGGVQGGLAGRF